MGKVVNVEFSQDKVIFLSQDGKGKPESFEYEQVMEPAEAMKAVRAEVRGRGYATRGALNLVMLILDNQRLSTYRGQTTIHSKIAPKVNSAVREVETEVLKPIYLAGLAKSMSDTQKLEAWDMESAQMRSPGIYAVVKGICVKYFAHVGRLPCVYDGDKPLKDKLLSVTAMQKILNNEKNRIPGIEHDASEALTSALDKVTASKLPALLGKMALKMNKEKDGLTAADVANIIGRLEQFKSDAVQLRNTMAAEATEALTKLGTVPGAQRATDIVTADMQELQAA